MALSLPVINTILKGITLVSTHGNSSIKIDAEMRSGLQSISRELMMIRRAIIADKYGDLQRVELVYDIDDFIDCLRLPGVIVGALSSAIGADTRTGQLAKIQGFREAIKGVSYIRTESELPKKIEASPSSAYTLEKHLVGFPETREDFVKRLFPPSRDGQLRPTNDLQQRVISIVGCRGSGKTALARAVYDHTAVPGEFDCKAWVVMPHYNQEKIVEDINSAEHSSSAMENLNKTVEDILKMILQEVRSSCKKNEDSSALSGSNTTAEEDDSMVASGESISEALRSFMTKRRYLVCIDDVQHKEVWDEIEDVLPVNDVGSRILVTTNVHSVAKACSSGSYVYKMKCLDRANSESLFWSKALGPSGVPINAVAMGSECIFDKCDGLPLALISAAKHLKGKPLEYNLFEDVGKKLGNFLSGHEIRFAEMKRVLVQWYGNLPDYSHKNCLVYASILPRGHQINIQSIARKLVAEELVEREIDRGISEVMNFVRSCMNELINQSMIEKVLTENDTKIFEMCKVQSIILEFIVEMALSENFVNVIDDRGTIRRIGAHTRRVISLQSPTEERIGKLPEAIDQSTVRSLTMVNSSFAKKKISAIKQAFQRGPSCFKKCQVLRVLDLEGCTGLDSGVLDDICGLVLLKYLGLRKTDVKKLPNRIVSLCHLQTLDIRETLVKSLSMEVIMLPELAYLFGMFKLEPLTGRGNGFKQFLSTESKLNTLAGVVMDETRNSVEVVIEYARSLKKVKTGCNNTSGLAMEKPSLWSSDPCSSTPDPALATAHASSTSETAGTPGPKTCASRLADALWKRHQDPFKEDLESLSIDFNGVSNEFLGTLNPESNISHIRSIKVRRGRGTLPDSAMLRKVIYLHKLHLFSTGLGIEELAALQSLPCLQYLKLAEDDPTRWDGNFEVKYDGFNSLLWLCFEAEKYPRILIEDGGMDCLASLLLLCPNSPVTQIGAAPGIEQEVGVNGMSSLKKLNEVILHRSAPHETLEAWNTAANLHINQPYVMKQEISTNNLSTPGGAVEHTA